METIEPGVQSLRATPTSLWGCAFQVEVPGHASVGELKLHWLREAGTLRDGERTFHFHRDGWLGGPYVMRRGARLVGRAVKPSALARGHELRHGGLRYELKPRCLTREFQLFRHGRRIGSVRPAGWASRRAEVTLEREVPLELALFALWLTLNQWRRAAGA